MLDALGEVLEIEAGYMNINLEGLHASCKLLEFTLDVEKERAVDIVGWDTVLLSTLQNFGDVPSHEGVSGIIRKPSAVWSEHNSVN